MDKDENEIISEYLNGNHEIFGEIVKKYTPLIYNFSARLVGFSNASDLTQDTFIKVWKNIKKFDSEKASLKTWIFTIAKNLCIDFLKKKKSLVFSELDFENEKMGYDETFSDNIPDDNPLPDDMLQKLQDVYLLNTLLDKLSVHKKTVLLLYYQEDMTFEEISNVLGKSLNTIKSQHRRAILELKKMMY